MPHADSGSAAQNAASQIKDKASEVASNVRDMGNRAYDAASEKYEDVRDAASEYYQAGRDKAMEWESRIESYVREQPIKSLLMAAGAGCLLGMIWKRI